MRHATALAERNGEGEAVLPGLARVLLAHGVPAVLAGRLMTNNLGLKVTPVRLVSGKMQRV